MRTSVAMATYQGARHLPEQLDSLLSQRRRPDELVVSDDGSTDGSKSVLHAFADAAPFPVRILQNPGVRGYRSNFDNALRHVRGDVIFLCDQDDIWLDRHVQSLSEEMSSTPDCLAVAGDSLVVNEHGQSAGYTIRISEGITADMLKATNGEAKNHFLSVLRHRAVTGHSMAISRSLLKYCLPLPPQWIHDQWAFLLAAAFGRASYADSIVSHYRAHGRQAVGAPNKSYRHWLSAPSRKGQVTEVDKWRELEKRLQYHRVDLVGAERIFGDLDRKIAFVERRELIRASGWVHRIGRASSTWARGDYRTLGRGTPSFARDVMAR